MTIPSTRLPFLLFCILLVTSCGDNEELKRELDIRNHPTVVLNAAYELGELKDPSAIKPLLTNILDPRMSTDIKFKGMTVCYSRLSALRKITGVTPSWKVNRFGQDTPAVHFYLQ